MRIYRLLLWPKIPEYLLFSKMIILLRKNTHINLKWMTRKRKVQTIIFFLYRANVWVKCYYIICTRYLIWLYALRTIGFIICLAVCSRFTNTNYINYFTKKTPNTSVTYYSKHCSERMKVRFGNIQYYNLKYMYQ